MSVNMENVLESVKPTSNKYENVLEMLNNPNYVLETSNLPIIQDALSRNPGYAIKFVKNHPSNMFLIPFDVQESHANEILEIAYNYPSAFRFISDKIKIANSNMCFEIIANAPTLLAFIPETMQLEYDSQIQGLIRANSEYYIGACDAFKINNPILCASIIKKNPPYINYTPHKVLLDNRKIFLPICGDSVKIDPTVYDSLPEEFKSQIEPPSIYGVATQQSVQDTQSLPVGAEKFLKIFRIAVKKDPRNALRNLRGQIPCFSHSKKTPTEQIRKGINL